MATNKQIKFYKVQNLPATLVVGAVYFEVSTQTIHVAKSTTTSDKFGVGLKNATLAGGILTIERYDSTTVTVDFNDIASASSVQDALNNINDKINTINGDGAGSIKKAVADEAQLREAADAQIRLDFAAADKDAAAAAADEYASIRDAISAAQTTLQGNIDNKADQSTTYTKTEVDNLVNAKANAANVYDKDAIDGKVNTITNAIKAEETRAKSVEDELRTAISTAASGATTEVVKDQTSTHITVNVGTGDKGQKVYTIGESDIASAIALENEIKDRAAEEGKINARIDLLDNATEGRVSKLEEKVNALNSATHFRGEVEFDPSVEGATTAGYEAGDIIIYIHKEFIFDGTNWIELGDTTAEGNRLTALEGLVGSTSVSAQIGTKIAELDATVGSTTVAEGKHVAVEVAEVDGKLTAVTVAENDIASAAKLSEVESEVDLNTAAVAEYKTRIEALEGTAGALGTTYVKVADYNVDKTAAQKKHADLQDEINAAEGRLDTAEADIDNLQSGTGLGSNDKPTYTGANYISNAATMVAADLALDSAIKALDSRIEAEENKSVVTSIVGNADINPSSATSGAVSLSLNKATSVAENDTLVVTSGAVYEALCWIEF